ncbi:MAG: FtsX-like permease family protein [Bacillaceae bacterium]
MYFKLSLRNAKRSFKDYAIYFLTLTFAVCIFYSFNSISAQQAMLDISKSQSEMIEMLMQLISAVSIFISFVLGFLILFANNFLIRRRKKELGMYMTLGMSKYRISQLLVVETFFIGLLSLASGLLIGTILSQGLSVLTAALFKVDVKKYEFVFSMDAMSKTILYFGIIFLVVMIFNTIVISKYKLIDLLVASKKNESLKIRKTSTSVILFIVSVVLLAVSYGAMMKYGLLESIALMWTCVALGSLGTFLFFFSLSGFLLNVLQRNKNVYFKNMNMFIFRQINSKVNTTFVSMTMICLMLFFTIGALSTGFSFKGAMEKDLDKAMPYDATLTTSDLSINEAMKKIKMNLDEYGKHWEYNMYDSQESMKKLLASSGNKNVIKKYFSNEYNQSIPIIKQSDYEQLMSLQQKQAVKLEKNEALLITNMSDFEEILKQFVKDNNQITIQGNNYPIADKGYEVASLYSSPGLFDRLTVVLPDDAVKGMDVSESIANIQYTGNKEKIDNEIYDTLDYFRNGQGINKYDFFLNGGTKTAYYDMTVGTSTTIVYLGIYLGIVFLISSAAILALQQLSEASDNIERYQMIRKIGVTRKGINNSIFGQIFIYFMMPLSLAIVHSIFGIQVVNEALIMVGEASVLLPSFITAIIIILVYGGYFIATYVGYKNIVK